MVSLVCTKQACGENTMSVPGAHGSDRGLARTFWSISEEAWQCWLATTGRRVFLLQMQSKTIP